MGELGDGVLPPGLAPPAHHQQVALTRRQVDDRTLVGLLVGVAVGPGPDQAGTASPHHEEGDAGVVEPLHVAVPVEGHAGALVSVPGHAGGGEAHAGPPSNGVGSNVMVWSYGDRLLFGIRSFAHSLDSPDELRQRLHAAPDELLARAETEAAAVEDEAATSPA